MVRQESMMHWRVKATKGPLVSHKRTCGVEVGWKTDGGSVGGVTPIYPTQTLPVMYVCAW